MLPPSTEEVVLTAYMEGNGGTRTTLDKDYTTVLWMPEESISVFREGKMAAFVSENTEKTTSALFKGTLPGDGSDPVIYGLYPYDKDATITKDVITTSLPDEQAAVAGTFDNNLFIAVARTESYELGFYNVCSGLRFMLDRNDIQRVSLLSNGGEPLAGKFSVGVGKDAPEIKEVPEGVSEVTLTAPEGKTFEKDVWYYLVTLPANLEKRPRVPGAGGLFRRSGLHPLRCVQVFRFRQAQSREALLGRESFRHPDFDISRPFGLQGDQGRRFSGIGL